MPGLPTVAGTRQRGWEEWLTGQPCQPCPLAASPRDCPAGLPSSPALTCQLCDLDIVSDSLCSSPKRGQCARRTWQSRAFWGVRHGLGGGPRLSSLTDRQAGATVTRSGEIAGSARGNARTGAGEAGRPGLGDAASQLCDLGRVTQLLCGSVSPSAMLTPSGLGSQGAVRGRERHSGYLSAPANGRCDHPQKPRGGKR